MTWLEAGGWRFYAAWPILALIAAAILTAFAWAYGCAFLDDCSARELLDS